MITVVPAPLKLPPFISASRWDTVVSALREHALKKRGKHRAKYPSGPVEVPRLTNGEVITILTALQPPLYGIRAQAFPLWDQLAAAAFGWNPKTGKLDTSARNRDAWFPDVLLVELWRGLAAAAVVLDGTSMTPRVDFDGRWDDVVFQSIIKQAVEQDSPITDTESAHAWFKIPLPACKGKDGKLHAPKCKSVMKRWPYLCEEVEKCAPVIVKDPITVVRDKATNGFQMLLLIGAIWIVLDNRKPRRRARRY